jgi:anterior pharynx defective protein 1
MGFLLFAGCSLVAFAFPATVFTLVVSKRIQLVIIAICSAFLWLLGLTVAALVRYTIPALQDGPYPMMVMSLITTEFTRYFLFRIYIKTERSFSVVSTNGVLFPMSDFYSSVAAGLGFGFMHSLLLYGSILSNALGPGTLFADTCPYFSTFVVSAWTACFFGILHVALMVIAFDALRRKHVARRMLLHVLLHTLAIGSTAVNTAEGGCLYALGSLLVVVMITGMFAVFTVNQRDYQSRKSHRD